MQKENSGTRSIKIADSELSELAEELKIGDKLAVERTILAADRTMLAGVRTSLSFIGFGFTIFNVLRYVYEHGGKLMRPETPRNVGIFMLVAGTMPLFVMMIQYCRTLQRMGHNEGVFKNPNFEMACIVFLLGTILLVTMIGNIVLL